MKIFELADEVEIFFYFEKTLSKEEEKEINKILNLLMEKDG